jgi:predicted 3-demethylubiquinone-9 3-methyltransferase (glyoxalase superfamily)
MSKISPMLWFDKEAEEAANLYVSVFPNSKILSIARYPEDSMGQPGSVMVVEFEIDGFKVQALNAGPMFQFSEAVSFVIDCKDQAEVDYYWEALLAGGGKESQCGWLKDRFNFNWQVVPKQLNELMSTGDGAQAARVNAAMMKMVKLDVAKLEAAARGAEAA